MPIRTCVGCRRRGPASGMVRLARSPEGELLLGRSMGGRGAWLCAGSPGCLAEAVRRKAFDRALRAPVSGIANEVAELFEGPEEAGE